MNVETETSMDESDQSSIGWNEKMKHQPNLRPNTSIIAFPCKNVNNYS